MSSIDDEIKEEIANNKILIYGKGTKSAPQCGFTAETVQFFDKYGHELFEKLHGCESSFSTNLLHLIEMMATKVLVCKLAMSNGFRVRVQNPNPVSSTRTRTRFENFLNPNPKVEPGF